MTPSVHRTMPCSAWLGRLRRGAGPLSDRSRPATPPTFPASGTLLRQGRSTGGMRPTCCALDVHILRCEACRPGPRGQRERNGPARTMRYFLLTDLEGPAGVCTWSQTREGDGPDKLAAMRLLTGEVNAVVAGILDTDANAEILAWDGHGTRGLLPELLHPRATFLPNSSPLREHLSDGVSALYFIGQHAMAGTENAPLCHTYNSRTIAACHLNDRPVGEFGCRAAMAGERGIPAVYLSGDDKAVAEALALIPDLITVTTKVGLGINTARHRTHAQSCAEQRAAATLAARRAQMAEPLRIPPPYTLRFEALPGAAIDPSLADGAQESDGHTVVHHAARLWDLPL